MLRFGLPMMFLGWEALDPSQPSSKRGSVRWDGDRNRFRRRHESFQKATGIISERTDQRHLVLSAALVLSQLKGSFLFKTGNSARFCCHYLCFVVAITKV